MNVEIGAEAALFPEKEYIKGIFVAVWTGPGNVTVSGVKINGWYKLSLEHTFEVHQRYIRYILTAGGRDGRFFSAFLIRHF
jgi:hypothetical protein